MATASRTGLPIAEELGRHAESAASLLKALASPHRLQILCVLGEGEFSVGALNERIALSQSALSQHLAVLRADGLVSTRRESQTIFYRVMPGPALDVIRVLHGHFCSAIRTRRK
jgi:DNA-binding transcriptional ArsR family regulator